ncbi:MAG: type II methionyl aminopeptidase [Nitrososphaerota archaeon]|nr:type II methionyl aminopeptidase [Candidatus Calditenuaceae archaeon]MDW8073290.1 type II methionyl aminopeptidase [Nitrososphaerota archaeon]
MGGSERVVFQPNAEQLDRLRQAGSVAGSVLREAFSRVRPGIRSEEVCEWIEARIRELGARPAFPCNIGIDSIAAHYTPTHGDDMVIQAGVLVKVDVGVELDGFIADTAATLDLRSPYGHLVDVAREALKNALKLMKAGVKVGEIGRVIYETATRMGCRPIANLSGHEIRRFNLHAGLSIPNIPSNEPHRLKAGHVYAVEPFITLREAPGIVINTKTVNIFSVRDTSPKPKGLSQEELEALREIVSVSRGLPYTTRWLSGPAAAIHPRLYKRGLVYGYPVLVEKSGAPVSQAEHTVLVHEDGCEVLTEG